MIGRTRKHGWIPCSEKLPEVGAWCIATFENGSVDKIRYTEKWGWNEPQANKVIAWQLLPEPYKKEV